MAMQLALSTRVKQLLQQGWRMLRHVSGDDAYECYLAHHAAHHPDAQPMERAAFFRSEQKRKWDGVRRCC